MMLFAVLLLSTVIMETNERYIKESKCSTELCEKCLNYLETLGWVRIPICLIMEFIEESGSDKAPKAPSGAAEGGGDISVPVALACSGREGCNPGQICDRGYCRLTA